jgi:hypothetical protein
MVDINRRFTKNNQILYKEMEGGSVLVDPYRRAAIRLNPVASEIWRLLDQGRSILEVIDILKECFDAGEEIMRKDALDFIEELIALEMIG